MGKIQPFEFEISAKSDVIAIPQKLSFRSGTMFSQNREPSLPLKYFSDILTGGILGYFCGPKTEKSEFLTFIEQWDPHIEMHNRSYYRLNQMSALIKARPQCIHSDQLNRVYDTLIESDKGEYWDLEKLFDLIDWIDHIEGQFQSPLLFNFQLVVDDPRIKDLHYLTLLLFHLRSLVILDYNQSVEDLAFESIRVDSVSDYLPKLESVTQDGMVFWHFQRMHSQMPTLVAQKMREQISKYISMGVTLIESLKSAQIQNLSEQDLFNYLNLIQIDWLYGTHSGILFRLREELEALRQGYHKVFYLEASPNLIQKANYWKFYCDLNWLDRTKLSRAV